MKNWRYSLFIMILLLAGCQVDSVNEEEVLTQYDDFLAHVDELFSYHVEEEGIYYNQKYHTDSAIRSLLDDYMTNEGIDRLIDTLYVQKGNRYVYQEVYQSYLKDKLDPQEPNETYYNVTRDTVLNPGLRFMMRDDLVIEATDDEIVLSAEKAHIQFYDQHNTYANDQFGRLGYPPVDHLSLHVLMVKEEKSYRISHVQVQS